MIAGGLRIEDDHLPVARLEGAVAQRGADDPPTRPRRDDSRVPPVRHKSDVEVVSGVAEDEDMRRRLMMTPAPAVIRAGRSGSASPGAPCARTGSTCWTATAIRTTPPPSETHTWSSRDSGSSGRDSSGRKRGVCVELDKEAKAQARRTAPGAAEHRMDNGRAAECCHNTPEEATKRSAIGRPASPKRGRRAAASACSPRGGRREEFLRETEQAGAKRRIKQ